MTDEFDLLSLFRVTRGFADGTYVANRRVRVVIETAEGEDVVIPIPVNRVPLAPPPPIDRDAGLGALELAIVEAVDEAVELLTGEELAEKTGYQFNGRFKDTLARLVKRGRIANKRPGYCRVEPE